MLQVIIVEPPRDREPELKTAGFLADALEQAIWAEQAEAGAVALTLQRIAGTQAEQAALLAAAQQLGHESVLCPLTLDLPLDFNFPGASIYQRCRQPLDLRQQVERWGYAGGEGCYWLPIVWTAKGPLYAEAIAQVVDDSQRFQQPWHLTDAQRQPLYRLSYRLLSALEAPPSVYLLQFGCQPDRLWFDRLWPFPAAPAIASLGVQSPDLLRCYWRCLIGKPILDLMIRPDSVVSQIDSPPEIASGLERA